MGRLASAHGRFGNKKFQIRYDHNEVTGEKRRTSHATQGSRYNPCTGGVYAMVISLYEAAVSSQTVELCDLQPIDYGRHNL
jgi:hypothetical protein